MPGARAHPQSRLICDARLAVNKGNALLWGLLRHMCPVAFTIACKSVQEHAWEAAGLLRNGSSAGIW